MRAVLLALTVASISSAALAGDLIRLTDGGTVAVPRATDPPSAADFAASTLTVLEENVDGIVYRIEGVPQKQSLTWARVRAVQRDPASVPPELTEGVALQVLRRFEEARAKFHAVAGNARAPLWSQIEASWRQAESLAALGGTPAAERALGGFIADRPRSRFVPDARRIRARVLQELGRDDDARGEFVALSQLDGISAESAASARFAAVWVAAVPALRSGDASALAAAEKAIDGVRVSASREIAARCDAARGACLAAQGRLGDAATALGPLVAESGDPFVLAVGNAILGDAAKARGGQALEKAQEHYLRAALLYREADGAGDFVAAAWFHAGELFVELAPKDAVATARARREWTELAERFPRSVWAKRARAAAASLQ